MRSFFSLFLSLLFITGNGYAGTESVSGPPELPGANDSKVDPAPESTTDISGNFNFQPRFNRSYVEMMNAPAPLSVIAPLRGITPVTDPTIIVSGQALPMHDSITVLSNGKRLGTLPRPRTWVNLQDPNCDFATILSPEISAPLRQLVGKCDQMAKDARWASSGVNGLTGLIAVCQCYESDSSLVSSALTDMNGRAPQITPQQQNSGSRRVSQRNMINSMGRINGDSLDPETVRSNVQTENALLDSLRNGVMVQASLLSNDPADRTRITGSYAQNWFSADPAVKSQIETLSGKVASRFDSMKKPGENPVSVQFTESPAYLDGSEPPDSCVSKRDFLAFRQFPENNRFYWDLANQQSYNEYDWDYDTLKEKLESDVKRKGFISLEEARNDKDTNYLINRLDFLHRNPMVRNMMRLQKSGMEAPTADLTLRQDLFNRFKAALVPGNINACARSTSERDSCRQSVLQRSENYRNTLKEFFDNPATKEKLVKQVMDANRTEFMMGLSSAEDKIFQSHHIVTPQEINSILPAYRVRVNQNYDYSQEISITSMGASGTGLGARALTATTPSSLYSITDDEDWVLKEARLRNLTPICQKIRESQKATENNTFVMDELERNWGQELDLNAGDDGNPNTTNFNEFQHEICDNRRADPASAPVSYNDFKKTYCTGRTQCTSEAAVRDEFIKRYPIGASGNTSLGSQIRSFDSSFKVTNLSSQDTQTVYSMNRSSYDEALSSSSRSISGDYSSSLPSGRMPASVATVTPGANAQTTTTANPNSAYVTPNFAANANINPESGYYASLPPAQVNAEKDNLRSQVRSSDNQQQSIRDELSSLRDSLDRENDKPSSSKDSKVVSELNDRISQLEARLAASRQQGEDAARKLAQLESETRTKPQSQAQDDSPASNRRSSLSQQSAAAQPVAPTGQQTAGVNSGSFASSQQLGGSGANLGSVSTGGGVRGAQSVRGGGNLDGDALLRSRYNIEPGSDQSKGAITVSDSGSSFNYQQLRTDSGNNEVKIPFSSQEFQNLPQAEKDRFIAQARALGSVVRLAYNDGVGYFLKSGQRESWVPVEQQNAQRAPASVPERSNKLIDLNNEIDRATR